MKSLRSKLAFSYGLLIITIFAVSAWSVHHLVTLGGAIEVILVNNYKSILAAENMKEALERQDSSATFLIAGYGDKARKQFQENAERFSQEFELASANVTEEGEADILADIGTRYQEYKSTLQNFLNAPGTNPSERPRIYFEQLEPAFTALKGRLDDLLHLNQQAMLAANARAIAVSRQARMSAAGIAALALVVGIVIAWRFTRSVVNPISALAEKARKIGEGDFDQHIEVSSKDEIGVLATEFNRMLTRLRDLRKSDYGRLLLEQEKSDAVLDSMYEPVIVTDARGHVTKINRAARELYGANNKSGEDDEMSLSRLAGGGGILTAVREAVEMQRPVAKKDDADAAVVPIKLDGAEHSFRLRATPIRDAEGGYLGAVTVLEDITALAEIDRLKTEFISVASGRLKQPLHSLQLALHTVIEGHTGDLTDEQRDMLENARRDAETLEELMSDLLELSEIESGTRRLSTERLRPIELARAAVDRFQAQADSKQIKLVNNVWPDLPWVVGDRRAIARVFDNLISNAIRHTDRDGQVTVEAGERSGRVYFRVRDTGEGIPARIAAVSLQPLRPHRRQARRNGTRPGTRSQTYRGPGRAGQR